MQPFLELLTLADSDEFKVIFAAWCVQEALGREFCHIAFSLLADHPYANQHCLRVVKELVGGIDLLDDMENSQAEGTLGAKEEVEIIQAQVSAHAVSKMLAATMSTIADPQKAVRNVYAVLREMLQVRPDSDRSLKSMAGARW